MNFRMSRLSLLRGASAGLCSACGLTALAGCAGNDTAVKLPAGGVDAAGAARSTHITICNLTDTELALRSKALQHGCWTVEPPARIPSFGVSRAFGSESCGVGTGTEGGTVYDGGPAAHQVHYNFTWDNPYGGSNTYTTGPSEVTWYGRRPCGTGNNTGICFVAYPGRASIDVAWMRQNRDLLGNRTLRNLCIPGSHDSGMSTFGPATAFAFKCNVLTQTTGIFEQLNHGARYFDLRLVKHGGAFFTGHFGYVDALKSYQGALGQSIAEVVDSINRFAHEELIILNLSHDMVTGTFTAFTQDDWNRLFEQLSAIQHLYVLPVSKSGADLTQMTLLDFTAGGKAVVIVVDPSDKNVTLNKYANRGFYPVSSFNVYNQYSNTNDLNQMMTDQIDRMKTQRAAGNYFLLSWTLTQGDVQATTCAAGTAYSIIDLANLADGSLYAGLLPACSKESYPNIIYTDNVSTRAVTALAMAINRKFA